MSKSECPYNANLDCIHGESCTRAVSKLGKEKAVAQTGCVVADQWFQFSTIEKRGVKIVGV